MANIQIPIPENPNDVLSQMSAFINLVGILRKECPWDKKQTNKTIAHLLIEEAYETLEAIENEDDEEFAKELGDLLLHIVMHSIMAEERGAFSLNIVISKIHSKMVNRHPHVFGEVVVKDENDVMQNWEQLKKNEGKKSALEGVPNNLPALLRAERIQFKASRVGFDWDKKEDVWDKVEEEMQELKEEIFATERNQNRINEEFGDLFFALVNSARFENVISEEVTQRANKKFTNRFQFIEEKAKEIGKEMKDMTLGEMDEYWNEAKKMGINS